jgi:hypothetical protein
VHHCVNFNHFNHTSLFLLHTSRKKLYIVASRISRSRVRFLPGWLAGSGWTRSIKGFAGLGLGEFLFEPGNHVFEETAEFGGGYADQSAFQGVPRLASLVCLAIKCSVGFDRETRSCCIT